MLKPFNLTLHRVHDRVRITEGSDHIVLHVDSDPNRIVAALGQAQKMMQALNKDSTEEEERAAAAAFAQAIFGKDQAEGLLTFYHNDAGCVINICGQYFSRRLSKIITKAQKKQRAEK